ncbi:MAG TPA: flagellar biosynthesis anti-sigma factor FlgM [Terriglobales bacterium]|jgi:negative regulator of flagellin synthesis FlgM
MKIDLNSLNLNNSSLDRTSLNQAQHSATSEIGAEGTQGQDSASLSLDQASIQSLQTQTLSTPEVRQDKVDALRQAIANGQYGIEPDKIADAMIQDSFPMEQ